jgi:putative peptidoglycan lipid II flippase
MARTLSNRQMIRAALVVILGFLASGILGLVRNVVVASAFGTSEARDAFIAAQRLPEIIFVLVAGGALGSSFIPVFARVRSDDEQSAWKLASATLTLSALGAGILGLTVFLFADPIVSQILLRERSLETQQLTANLMRMMMLTPFIFSISGLIMGILQSNGMFILPSLAISMNHLGIMLGALLIAPALTPTQGIGQVGNNNIYGLAIGAILSAVLHLSVQLPGVIQLRAPLRVSFDWRANGVLDVLKLMLPRSLGVSVVQLNYVVNIILTSNMVVGSLAALDTAFILIFFALGVIGQGIGSAVFPTLAELYSKHDMDGYKERLVLAMRGVIFLALPATAVFILLGEPIVSLFERGEWTRTSTLATAWALAFYALGIFGFALLEVLSRAFYAIEDTWTPVLIGIGAMLSNIVLSVVFVQFLGNPNELTRGAFAGLALANALTTNIEALLLWALLRRKIGAFHDRELLAMLAKTTLATLVMSIGLWGMLQVVTERSLWVALLGGVLGGGVFFAVSIALGIQEATAVPMRLLRRFKR